MNSKLITRLFFSLMMALSLPAFADDRDHDHGFSSIRVHVNGTTARAYNSHTGALLATWYNYTDFKVAGNIVVLRDTSRYAIAVNSAGQVLARWYRCVDYQLSRFIVVLRDEDRLTTAVTEHGRELARWHRTIDYSLSGPVVALRDSDNMVTIQSAFHGELARWHRTVDYDTGRGVGAALDNTGELIVVSADKALTVRKQNVDHFHFHGDHIDINYKNGGVEYLPLPRR